MDNILGLTYSVDIIQQFGMRIALMLRLFFDLMFSLSINIEIYP